jgi:glycosyltransferase involved in cell wall biosynthesis
MKIVHINTTDNGGAAIACIKQHCNLLKYGVNSYLVTLKRTQRSIPNHLAYSEIPPHKQNFANKLRNFASELILNKDEIKRIVKPYSGYFSFINTIYDVSHINCIQDSDIINLHWVADFIDWKSFFHNLSHKNFVWTLHDMGPFTGGYHYSNGFRGYEKDDKDFPPLSCTRYKNFTHKILKKKQSIIDKNNINLSIVADSNWLANCARKSVLFKNHPVSTIYYGFDTETYKIIDKKISRQNLNLPQDSIIILFVSQNVGTHRKGFRYLIESLYLLNQISDKNIFLCSVGNTCENLSIFSDLNYRSFEFVGDTEYLAQIYNAADIFVCPSIEEAFGQTVIESFLCGTPVVGFSVGGLTETIIDGFNGLLCKKIDSNILCLTILEAISKLHRFNSSEIRKDAVIRFNQENNTYNYIQLYKKILNSN